VEPPRPGKINRQAYCGTCPGRLFAMKKSNAGFTLIELLVVVTIVTLLLAMILPCLNNAMELPRKTRCQMQLSDIVAGFTQYHTENNGTFPRCALGWSPLPEDWLWWTTGRDVQKSGIGAYFSGNITRVLVCPSDNLNVRPRVLTEPYRYSYTFNGPFSCDWTPSLRWSQVVNLGQKYLVVDEDAISIDDGHFHPLLVGTYIENFLGTRHDGNKQTIYGKGNVGFLDGHAEYVTRDWTHMQAHYDPLY
jgi:prepilin-type N-terminal cleavage/methylation domain-containing protein/prepilin-type processing-associated H-X9-DG protein